jgi:ATP-dependent DNA ligase
MEKYVGPEVDCLARILEKSRKELLGLNLQKRRAHLKKLLNEKTLLKLKRGKKIGNI